MLEDMLEAMLEAEDMTEDSLELADDMAALSVEDISIMELMLLLSGGGVELGAAEPSQVAAVGRLLTPWPAQREFANSMVFFWSSSLQAVLTQHERPERRVSELQMHFTSSWPQSPKLVPTQVAAQVGRPGICAAARVDSRATAVRVKACILAKYV